MGNWVSSSGQQISAGALQEAAAASGMSVSAYASEFGFKYVEDEGKQNGSASQSPLAGPRIDGGSRSVPSSLGLQKRGDGSAEAYNQTPEAAPTPQSLFEQTSRDFAESARAFMDNNFDAEGNYVPPAQAPVNSFQGEHGEDENTYIAPGRAKAAKEKRIEDNAEKNATAQEWIDAETLASQYQTGNQDRLTVSNITPDIYQDVNNAMGVNVPDLTAEDDYEEYGRIDYDPSMSAQDYYLELRKRGITTEQDIAWAAQEMNLGGDVTRMNLQFNPENNTEVLNKWLGDDYYSKLSKFNIDPQDFAGFLKKTGYHDILNEEWDNIYEGSDLKKDEKLAQAKEDRIINIVWEYLEEGSLAGDYQHFFFNEYLKNPEKYNQIEGGMGGAYAEYVKSQGTDMFTNVWGFDNNTASSFAWTFAPTLTNQNEINQKAWREAYEERKRGEGFDNSYIGIGINTVGSMTPGMYNSVEGMVDWVGQWIPGTDNFYTRKRLRDRYETSIMGYSSDISYAYVSGVGAEYINGITYVIDEDGGLYDITNGARVDMFEDSAKVQKIMSYVEENGKLMNDFSAYGTSEQGGRIAGDLVVQLLGTKGTGAARTALSTKIMARANGFKNASSFRKYIKHVKTKPGFTKYARG